MFRTSRLLAFPIIAAGVVLVASAAEAQAQVRVQIGGFGVRGGVHRGGHYFVPNHNYLHSAHHRRHVGHGYGHHGVYPPRVQLYGHAGYHGQCYPAAPHLDWHPPSYYWHGNHLDFQPGHFDVHRSRHWHP